MTGAVELGFGAMGLARGSGGSGWVTAGRPMGLRSYSAGVFRAERAENGFVMILGVQDNIGLLWR